MSTYPALDHLMDSVAASHLVLRVSDIQSVWKIDLMQGEDCIGTLLWPRTQTPLPDQRVMSPQVRKEATVFARAQHQMLVDDGSRGERDFKRTVHYWGSDLATEATEQIREERRRTAQSRQEIVQRLRAIADLIESEGL